MTDITTTDSARETLSALTCPNGHGPEVGWVHWESAGVKRLVRAATIDGKLQIQGLIADYDAESGFDSYLMCNECSAEFATPEDFDWV